jgi:glycosyltransferase involved in cell wall biosynthesis
MQFHGWHGQGYVKHFEYMKEFTKGRPLFSLNSLCNNLERADCVVFHRPLQKEALDIAIRLKEAGKAIVLDNDDTYLPNTGFPPVFGGLDVEQYDIYLTEATKTLASFAKLADLVTVSTPCLRDEYLVNNANTVVLPNTIRYSDWPNPRRNRGGKCRIGIVGSAAIGGDYASAVNTLRTLSRRADVQLVLFGLSVDKIHLEGLADSDIRFWSSLSIEHHPLVPQDKYVNTLNSLELDIILIPRRHCYFNQCKSNIKFLEASMLEIPVIAQSFEDGSSPYESSSRDAEYLLSATDDASWMANANELINDKNLRYAMGRSAREYVSATYDISRHAHRWSDAYSLLTERNQTHSGVASV